MYKAIIFDFFDVIRTDAYKTWLRLHDYKLEGEFLEVVQKQDRGEINTDEFLATLSKLTGQAAEAIFEEMESGASIDYDVLSLVARLQPQFRIGLLSNAPKGLLRAILKDNDLEKYFHEIVISSEVGFIKPQREIFQHMLAQLGVSAHEAIFIDDNPSNVAEQKQSVLKASCILTCQHFMMPYDVMDLTNTLKTRFSASRISCLERRVKEVLTGLQTL